MFFDLLKAVGAVVAVLSEVLKLETEAVPVSTPVSTGFHGFHGFRTWRLADTFWPVLSVANRSREQLNVECQRVI